MKIKLKLKMIMAIGVFIALLFPPPTFAVDESTQQMIDKLSGEIEKLKKALEDLKEKEKKDAAKEKKEKKEFKRDMKELERAVKKVEPWGRFELKGDFRFKIDSVHASFKKFTGYRWNPDVTWSGDSTPKGAYQPKSYNAFNDDNNFLNTNRLRLSMKAKVTEDIDFVGRLAMYKIWGHDTGAPLGTSIWTGGDDNWDSFQAQNDMLFDGNRTHRPSDSALRVDRAFFEWVQPFGFKNWWTSFGRRPSTGGPPSHLREGLDFKERLGAPSAMLYDYAFDGGLIGYAPTEGFPQGFTFRICYGKGFDSGLKESSVNNLNDSQFTGFNIDLYNTPDTLINLMVTRAFDIPDLPEKATADIGDITSGSFLFMKKSIIRERPIEWFGALGVTRTHPEDTSNWNFYVDGDGSGVYGDSSSDAKAYPGGLLIDQGGAKESHTGWAAYAGVRVPYGEKNKFGLEFNYGSKYWLPFTTGGDDIYGSKFATRGYVGEAYWTYDITKGPVWELSRAFLKLSYQHYEFLYSGSGLMLGEPKKLSENPSLLWPSPDKMDNILLSFNIYF